MIVVIVWEVLNLVRSGRSINLWILMLVGSREIKLVMIVKVVLLIK